LSRRHGRAERVSEYGSKRGRKQRRAKDLKKKGVGDRRGEMNHHGKSLMRATQAACRGKSCKWKKC